jgi:hypothetical protein
VARDTANVPEDVMEAGVTESIDGTVIPTEVTVPVVGVVHESAPETTVSTWLFEPVVREIRVLVPFVHTSVEADSDEIVIVPVWSIAPDIVQTSVLFNACKTHLPSPVNEMFDLVFPKLIRFEADPVET